MATKGQEEIGYSSFLQNAFFIPHMGMVEQGEPPQEGGWEAGALMCFAHESVARDGQG